MNPLTLEWVEKAEGDFITARRELHARAKPNYDAACFHAQQMAEKYLKAMLQEFGLSVPKTHSLVDLNAVCVKVDPTMLLINSDLNVMEGYAIQFRYPGQSAEREEAKQAVKAAQAVRLFIRGRMGLA